MKNISIILAILTVSLVNAQSFSGKGDKKFQVGANFQNNSTSLNVSFDYGLGENISVGVSSSYALGISNALNADFGDRIDIKARFNANIGNVINIDPKIDIYPGLHFSLKNLGGHLGARYFFSEGFGVYSELSSPIAKYNSKRLSSAEKIHNQVTVSIGVVFNL